MKMYFSLALALVCAGLVIALLMMKSRDAAQHENDAGAIADFSNRLDTAQSQIMLDQGKILVFSNNLIESQSALLTISNHLVEAGSTLALDAEQITNLNRQVAQLESANQTFGQQVLDLTNQLTSQVATLAKQIAQAEAGLNQANSNYVLLENRLRRDVAERLVIQRKFYNISELQAQMQRLKDDPFIQQISEPGIYAGLDVEVKSNAFHVIAPN
jgi:chromosome segregation ATPase